MTVFIIEAMGENLGDKETNKRVEAIEDDLLTGGLRILARIIAKAYLKDRGLAELSSKGSIDNNQNPTEDITPKHAKPTMANDTGNPEGNH